MKKNIYCLLAALFTMCLFTACSDDDDPVVPGSKLEDKVYTDEAGLNLSVNGIPTLGKTIDFKHIDGDKATVTLAGERLNVSSIIGGIMSKADNQPAAGIMIPTPGVIPGSASVEIPVTLQGDSKKCTFEGSHDTEYATFDYTGVIDGEALSFEVKNLKLKNTSMAATFATNTNFMEDDGWGGQQPNAYRVFRLIWESEKGLEVMPGVAFPHATVIGLMTAMPMIKDEEGNPAQMVTMLSKVLKNIKLGEDGSVTATYADTKKPGWPETTSPTGFAQYVVKADGTILLFVNPQAIMASVIAKASKSRAFDINAVVEGLMTDVVPMLVNGIPVSYGRAIFDQEGNESESASDISFYIDENVLLPILNIVSPLLEDEEVVNAIVEAAASDPDMGYMAEMLPGILASVPGVVETTTKIQLGINCVRE